MPNYENVFQQEAKLGKVKASVNVGTTPSATVQARGVVPRTNLTANITKDILTGRSSKGISAETYLPNNITASVYGGSLGNRVTLSRPHKYGNYGFQHHDGVNSLFINFHKQLR